MAQNVCPQCGAPNAPDARECKYCGEAFAVNTSAAQPNYQSSNTKEEQFDFNAQEESYRQQATQQQNYYYQQQQYAYDGINPAWPIKSKIAAGLLGIFLGGLGIHKFYMGRIGLGVVYLLFSWTFIPGFIGFIEGIIYLCSNDHNFQVKHHVRLH
jgi:TM2 domain-containing membrane protein YozV